MKLCTYCNPVAMMLVVSLLVLLPAESRRIRERALQRKRSWDGAQTADMR